MTPLAPGVNLQGSNPLCAHAHTRTHEGKGLQMGAKMKDFAESSSNVPVKTNKKPCKRLIFSNLQGFSCDSNRIKKAIL